MNALEIYCEPYQLEFAFPKRYGTREFGTTFYTTIWCHYYLWRMHK